MALKQAGAAAPMAFSAHMCFLCPLHPWTQQLTSRLVQTGLPTELWPPYLALAVVPAATPLPMSMLQLLWELDSPEEAQTMASIFNQVQILRLACLDDGSVWSLVQPEHAQLLQVPSLLLWTRLVSVL